MGQQRVYTVQTYFQKKDIQGKGTHQAPDRGRETPLGAPRATLGVLSLKPKGTPWMVITLFYISEILYNN